MLVPIILGVGFIYLGNHHGEEISPVDSENEQLRVSQTRCNKDVNKIR